MDEAFTSAPLGNDSSNHADEDATHPRPSGNAANDNLSHRSNASGAPAALQVPGQQPQIPGQRHVQQQQQQQSGPARPGQQAASGATPRRLSSGALFQQLEESGVIRTPQQRQQINDLKQQIIQMTAQGVSINTVEFRSKLQEIIPRPDFQKFLLRLVQRSNNSGAPAQVQQQQARLLNTQQVLCVHQAFQHLSQQRRGIVAVLAPNLTPQQLQELKTCENKLKLALQVLIKHIPQVKQLVASLRTTQPQLSATLQNIVNQHEETYKRQVRARAASAQQQQSQAAAASGAVAQAPPVAEASTARADACPSIFREQAQWSSSGQLRAAKGAARSSKAAKRPAEGTADNGPASKKSAVVVKPFAAAAAAALFALHWKNRTAK